MSAYESQITAGDPPHCRACVVLFGGGASVKEWCAGTSGKAGASRAKPSSITCSPGAMTPPRNTPSALIRSSVVAVPASTTHNVRIPTRPVPGPVTGYKTVHTQCIRSLIIEQCGRNHTAVYKIDSVRKGLFQSGSNRKEPHCMPVRAWPQEPRCSES